MNQRLTRTSIRLPEELHWRLQKKVLERGLSTTQAIQQAIEAWLRAPEPSTEKEKELDCFAIVKEVFENSPFAKQNIFDTSAQKDVPAQLAHKHTNGYFAVYLNKPSRWAVRIHIKAGSPWAGFNLNPKVATPLIPTGFTQMDWSPYTPFRVGINAPEDLRAFGRLILAAFQQTIEDRRGGRDTPSSSQAASAG